MDSNYTLNTPIANIQINYTENSNKSTSQVTNSTYNIQIPQKTLNLYSCNNSDFYSRESVGGKGLFLQRMQEADIPMPKFSLVSTQVLQEVVNYNFNFKLINFLDSTIEYHYDDISITKLYNLINDDLNISLVKKNELLQKVYEFIKSDAFYQIIKNLPVAEKIRKSYQKLIADDIYMPVIVRSSSIAEDKLGDAQAGKYESVIHNTTDIVTSCLKVIASAYNPNIASTSESQSIAIVLQQCIDCSFGGVAFSNFEKKADSLENNIHIEYTPGQPKGAVSGTCGITPHNYNLAKNKFGELEISFTPGVIASNYSLTETETGFTEDLSTNKLTNNQQLTEKQLCLIFKNIKTLEAYFSCPIEIEFAISKKDSKLYILQVRPITKQIGSMSFTVSQPESYIASGKAVSDGITTGPVYFTNHKTAIAEAPEGAIIVAHHASEWMLYPDFLSRVSGFIFKYGGINDHIAISLRQANKTCIIATDEFDKAITKIDETATLVAGSFQDNLTGYLINNSDKLFLLNSIVYNNDIFSTLTNFQLNKKPLIVNFTEVGAGFKWLNDANSILLKLFNSTNGMSFCFSENNFLQLCMHPQRMAISEAINNDINYFLTKLATFIQGFKLFYSFANPGMQESITFYTNQYNSIAFYKLKDDIDFLEKKLQLITENIHKINNQIAFTNPELTWEPLVYNLEQKLLDYKKRKSILQDLNLSTDINEVQSAHDMIYFIHKQFVNYLPVIAVSSNQYNIIEENSLIWINSTDENNDLLNTQCIKALQLTENPCKKTILYLNNMCFISIPQNVHFCDITIVKPDENNKGMLSLKYSDLLDSPDLNLQGRYKRMWFFAKCLQEINLNATNNIEVNFNSNVNTLTICLQEISTTVELQNNLLNFLYVFSIIESLNSYLDDIIVGNEAIWNKLTLEKLLDNITPESNYNTNFALCLFTFNYNLTIKEAEKYSTILNLPWNNTFYKQIINLGKEFRNVKTTGELNKLLTTIDNQYQINEILRFFIMANPKLAIPLVENINPTIITLNLAKKLIKFDVDYMRVLPARYKKNRDFCLAALEFDYNALEYMPEDIKQNKEKLLPILLQDGTLIRYVSKNCHDYADLIGIALQQNLLSVKYLDLKYRNNKYLMQHLIKLNADCTKFIGSALINDIEIINI